MQGRRLAGALVVFAVFALGGCGELEPVPSGRQGVCAEVQCGQGRCVEDGGRAKCLCDTGFSRDGLRCVPTSMCTPNPCLGGVKPHCGVVDDEPACFCEPGHAPEGDGCAAQSPWACGSAHVAGGDALEPDDCPSLAPLQQPGLVAPSGRTLAPAGDVDWTEVPLRKRHSYAVMANSFAAGLSLDVFGPDGVTPVALDRSSSGTSGGLLRPQQDGPYFIRVQASPGSSGAYSLVIRDEGGDDFGDAPADASALTLGEARSGVVRGSSDRDVFSFPVVAGHFYRAVLDPTSDVTLSIVDAQERAVPLLDSSIGSSALRLTLRAAADATLYAVVKSRGAFGGKYSLRVDDLGLDDHGDTPETATPLSPEAPGVGALQVALDVDVFAFDTLPNHGYRLTCADANGLCSVLVRDARDEVVADSATQVLGVAEFLSREGGRHSVAVSAGGSSVVAYALTLEDLGLDVGDTIATATPLAVPTLAGRGRVEIPGDRDVFRFEAEEGHVYRVVSPETDTTPYVSLRLLDGTGQQLQAAKGSSGVLAHEATASGPLFLEIAAASGRASGSYTFSLEDLGLDDFGDTFDDATAMLPGAPSATGRLESFGDVDVFSFAAVAGHSYQFLCTNTGTLRGGCLVRMRDAAGALLAEGKRAPATLSAVADGTVFVEVRASAALGTTDALGPYERLLVDVGADDFGDDAASATRVQLASDVRGILETRSDVDVFVVAMPAGHFLKATCTSAQFAGCSVQLKALAGTRLDTGDPSAKVPEEMDVYVELRGGTSGYTLRLEDLGPDDFGDDLAHATPITLGSLQSGRIEIPGDLDVFSVSLSAGVPYALVMSGAPSGALLDARGTYLQAIRTTPMTYTPRVSGTFYVRVSGGASSGPVNYSFSVR